MFKCYRLIYVGKFFQIVSLTIETRYEKHKGVNGVTSVNGDNHSESDVFETPHSRVSHYDTGSKKLTSIVESKESGDELANEERTTNKAENTNSQHTSVPKITIRDVESESGNSVVLNEGKVNGKSDHSSRVGNNNETAAEVVSAISGPTFYGVAVVEPCTVAQVQVEEAEGVETPEIKVTCVKEESVKSSHEPVNVEVEDETNLVKEVNHETSSLDENDDDDELDINMMVICQFLK